MQSNEVKKFGEEVASGLNLIEKKFKERDRIRSEKVKKASAASSMEEELAMGDDINRTDSALLKEIEGLAMGLKGKIDSALDTMASEERTVALNDLKEIKGSFRRAGSFLDSLEEWLKNNK